jgi:hypothetical protein
MESCPDGSPKTVKWKNKLRRFIEPQEIIPVGLGSRTPKVKREHKTMKTVKYFGYNQADDDSFVSIDGSYQKNIEIIQRAKMM